MNEKRIGKTICLLTIAAGMAMASAASMAVTVRGTWVFYDENGDVVGGKTIPCPPASPSSWGVRGVSTVFHPLNCPAGD